MGSATTGFGLAGAGGTGSDGLGGLTGPGTTAFDLTATVAATGELIVAVAVGTILESSGASGGGAGSKRVVAVVFTAFASFVIGEPSVSLELADGRPSCTWELLAPREFFASSRCA